MKPFRATRSGDVVGVRGEQLFQLVEEQTDDAGLGRVEPGDHVATAGGAEGFHESRW